MCVVVIHDYYQYIIKNHPKKIKTVVVVPHLFQSSFLCNFIKHFLYLSWRTSCSPCRRSWKEQRTSWTSSPRRWRTLRRSWNCLRRRLQMWVNHSAARHLKHINHITLPPQPLGFLPVQYRYPLSQMDLTKQQPLIASKQRSKRDRSFCLSENP